MIRAAAHVGGKWCVYDRNCGAYGGNSGAFDNNRGLSGRKCCSCDRSGGTFDRDCGAYDTYSGACDMSYIQL